MKAPRIAIFAGPSGGHLFPALAYAEAVRERWPESRLFLVSSRRAESFTRHFQPGLFQELIYLREFPFPSGISLRSLRFLIEFPRAFMDSSKILSKVKPDLCAGFGSFVSYPGMRLAMLRNIPNFIHEQNVVPGKATRMLVRAAQVTAETFENTFEKGRCRSLVTTGLPVRNVLRRAALAPAARGKETFTVLVVGGSQGAHGLNEKISGAFLRLSSEEKKDFAVIHITGRADENWVREIYRTGGIRAEVYAFHERMHELYGRADMAMTRAGANTLFELSLFKIPALVIPYPYAGAHQAENSRYFEKRGGLYHIEEKDAAPETLLAKIRQLRSDVNERQRLSESIAGFAAGNAAKKLAVLTGQLLGEN